MATTTMTMAKALNEGLRRAMEKNPKVLLMGEDIGRLGGVFRITDGLQKDFGEDRVIDSPLAESAIVGTVPLILAIRGYRAVCEIQFDGDLVYPGSSTRSVSQGRQTATQAFRTVRTSWAWSSASPFKAASSAIEHHSESPEPYFAQDRRTACGVVLDTERRLLDDSAVDRAR